MKKLLYVLLFGVTMYLGIQQAREMGASRDWSTTEGVIDTSRIARRHKTSSEHTSPAARHEYSVTVQYSYHVDGVSYSGSRLRIRPVKYRSKENAQRELAEYPAGQRVRVYYDPKQPERSVLKLH